MPFADAASAVCQIAYFADLGLFTMSEVHKLARRTRSENNWLESPSRENCTPGSEGGDGGNRSLPPSYSALPKYVFLHT